MVLKKVWGRSVQRIKRQNKRDKKVDEGRAGRDYYQIYTMKKLSNRLSVKQSSTKEGQRELLREHTNKINNMIDWVTALEQREAKHELDVITSMQYLEKRINNKSPYTAMRSTGEYCECPNPKVAICINNKCTGKYCQVCGKDTSFKIIRTKPIKPQEDVKKKLITYLTNHIGLNNNLDEIAGRILAIVKGE